MQHQKPYTKVIEAEVVEEVRVSQQGATQHRTTPQASAPEQDQFSLRSGLVMFIAVAALVGGVYGAHSSGVEARAAQAVKIEQDYRLALNAAPENLYQTASYTPASRGHLQQQPRRAAPTPIVTDMSASLDRLNQIVERRRALNEVEFQMLQKQLGDDGYHLSETQTRELLLAAGYRPPPRLPAERKPAAGPAYRESDAEMARYVANELVRDEIQGFLKKLQILAAVGGHIVER